MAPVYSRSFYRALKSQATESARQILPFVIQHLHPKSVVDVGCGSGDWLNVCAELGIGDIYGIDFHKAEILNIGLDRYARVDLTKPFDLPRKYDLAMSFEVGEHLPPKSAESFVESMTKLAPALLFSAAIPGQGGTNHVNEQWPSYWASHFEKFGYEAIDCVRRTFWENRYIAPYYTQNMVLYLKDARPYEELKRLPTFSMLPVVHPKMYEDMSREAFSLRPLKTARGLVNRLPGALWNSIAGRVRKVLDR
jgi:SAM-dependent methyltransferase